MTNDKHDRKKLRRGTMPGVEFAGANFGPLLTVVPCLCFPRDSMELRKDPITRSWVIVGDDVERQGQPGYCPFCPGAPSAPQVIATLNSADHGAGPVTAMVHPAL